MANTAEGLEVGGPEGLDPNDPAAFAQIMEGRGVAKTDEDTLSPDTSVASGLTTDAGPEQEPGRSKDTGRFVAKEEAAAPVVPKPATDTSGEATGDAEDPEIQAVLAKYNGDVNAALKGLAGAQSLIGRRDERADTLERELAEMRGRLEGFMAAGGGTQTVPLSDEQVVEIATSQIEQKGYSNAAAEAANHSHTSGDDRAYRAILEQWAIESPVDAMDFNTDFRLWQRDQRNAATAPEQPAWATTVAEQVATDALTQQIEAVATERGVAKDSPIIEQMLPALEQMPSNILEMVGSTDPEAQAAAVRLVMDRATLLAGAAAAVAPVVPEVEPTVPAAVARKLAGAAVASGALRPPETAPASGEQTREQAIAKFKRDIVEAPTTNITSGLTYGPTP